MPTTRAWNVDGEDARMSSRVFKSEPCCRSRGDFGFGGWLIAKRIVVQVACLEFLASPATVVRWMAFVGFFQVAFLQVGLPASAQTVEGEEVPRSVFEIYERGLEFLTKSQNDRGTWPAGEGVGPGTTGLALMAFLASGEDPNFGPHRDTIRRGLRHLIGSQSEVTGYMGPSMYHHGFATLALCEAYGVIDETDLFESDDPTKKRTIGQAVELAVRASLTSQKRNRRGGWRYAPNASDADTSVSGAILMSLLAARNAGIEVPDESIKRAIDYFVSMTSGNGVVGYASGGDGSGESIARSSIANLVFSIARRKDLKAFESTKAYIVSNQDADSTWPEYARYYQAQALFQADIDSWKTWNARLIRELKRTQQPDGSFDGDLGITNSTSMSLLALAVNFRFLPIYER